MENNSLTSQKILIPQDNNPSIPAIFNIREVKPNPTPLNPVPSLFLNIFHNMSDDDKISFFAQALLYSPIANIQCNYNNKSYKINVHSNILSMDNIFNKNQCLILVKNNFPEKDIIFNKQIDRCYYIFDILIRCKNTVVENSLTVSFTKHLKDSNKYPLQLAYQILFKQRHMISCMNSMVDLRDIINNDKIFQSFCEEWDPLPKYDLLD